MAQPAQPSTKQAEQIYKLKHLCKSIARKLLDINEELAEGDFAIVGYQLTQVALKADEALEITSGLIRDYLEHRSETKATGRHSKWYEMIEAIQFCLVDLYGSGNAGHLLKMKRDQERGNYHKLAAVLAIVIESDIEPIFDYLKAIIIDGRSVLEPRRKRGNPHKYSIESELPIPDIWR